jgi:hypothetical protein
MKRFLGRPLKAAVRVYASLATAPFRLSRNRVQKPAHVSHSEWQAYLSEHFNKPGMRVLELGSRNVTGNNLRSRFAAAEYVGFDYYEGENVDVAGDAHKLASYFPATDKFDLIFSSAVFEHLCMPWLVAEEISKLLKIGGFVFIETHFSHSSHERPWNFFQFSDMGLRALFSDAMGFDLIDRGMSNPISGYFAHNADPYLRHLPVAELYCHSEILCIKRREVIGFDWRTVSVDRVVDGTLYPSPRKRES